MLGLCLAPQQSSPQLHPTPAGSEPSEPGPRCSGPDATPSLGAANPRWAGILLIISAGLSSHFHILQHLSLGVNCDCLIPISPSFKVTQIPLISNLGLNSLAPSKPHH